jgi:hypothetical protein
VPSQPPNDRPGQSLLPRDGTRLRISSVPVRIAQRSQALSWLLAKNAYRAQDVLVGTAQLGGRGLSRGRLAAKSGPTVCPRYDRQYALIDTSGLSSPCSYGLSAHSSGLR